jgi:hypothetical protein
MTRWRNAAERLRRPSLRGFCAAIIENFAERTRLRPLHQLLDLTFGASDDGAGTARRAIVTR